MRPGRTQWLVAAVVWPVLATAQPTITSDGRLGTTVAQVGNNYTISGGTVTGGNLFFSFDKFSVPTLGTATFNGPTTTQNVISRVTGGELSSIDGTLSTRAGTSPMPSANFFFINPNGFAFGPKAKLDTGGAVYISSAQNIQLSDGTNFSAKPATGEVLTSAPPQAFGFLANNPAPLAFNGTQLSVTPGKTLSLIGGDVSLSNAAVIAARGGLVQIASVASPGNVVLSASDLGTGAFSNLGQVSVSGGGITAATDGPSRAGGTVFIRSGELIVDGAQILSDNFRIAGPAVALDIHTAGSLILRKGALLQTSSSFTASASGISIVASDVNLSETSAIQSIGLRSTGNAGAVDIQTASANLSSGAAIRTVSAGGSAGDIRIKASGSVTLSGAMTEIRTGGGANVTNKDPRIVGGNISVEASDVVLSDRATISSGNANAQGGESVSVTATNAVSISGLAGISSFASTSIHTVGGVTISAAQLAMDGGYINATTLGGTGGGSITVNATTVSLTNGAQIASSSQIAGSGAGGSIQLNAGSVSLSGIGPADGVGSVIFTGSPSSGLFSTTAGRGNAGQISVAASSLTIADGAKISVTSTGAGNAGTITANVGNMSVSDGRLDSSTSASGAGGAINVTASSEVSIVNGGRISADSIGAGPTGNVVVTAGDRITMNGGSISTRALTSDGGDITLKAPVIVRLENAQITTSVQSGTGGGGNIIIDPQFLIANNSAITANAFGGPGGNITIIADNFLPSSTTLLQASSAFSTPGTIQIVSPENNVAGSVAQLPRAFVDASRLLRGACTARREGAPSSFVLAGRGGVPADADGYLPSTIGTAPPAALALAYLDDCAR